MKDRSERSSATTAPSPRCGEEAAEVGADGATDVVGSGEGLRVCCSGRWAATKLESRLLRVGVVCWVVGMVTSFSSSTLLVS